MARTVIENDVMLLPSALTSSRAVAVENGRIVSIENWGDEACDGEIERIDGQGRLLTAGLVDIHTHGIHECMYETGRDALLQAAQELGRYGTTSVLPTIYSLFNKSSLKQLAEVAQAVAAGQDNGSPIVGLHLEGPFLAIAGAGAATWPGDVGFLNEILAACARQVRAMSISPETPNIIAVIERLCEEGVSVFITHTRASVEQTQEAIDAGARHATHFYDVFPLPSETEPGVRPSGAVETIIADPRVSVDFIADGVHVHPVAVKAALAAKGPGGVALITDSNVGAGLPAGVYPTPWGYSVKVSPDDAARIADERHPDHGCLAGSTLTMDRGIRNLKSWLDRPLAEILAMGTSTPARIAGLTGKGKIAVGADADLVLWDSQLRPVATWVAGRCVFDAAQEGLELQPQAS